MVLLGSSAVPAGPAGLGALYGLVRDTAAEWAVLRPSWFMQNFTGDHSVALGVRAGEIVTATGARRVPSPTSCATRCQVIRRFRGRRDNLVR
ncbi:hypothetical protein ACWIGW_01720 [Nocardia brasiliensis]